MTFGPRRWFAIATIAAIILASLFIAAFTAAGRDRDRVDDADIERWMAEFDAEHAADVAGA